MPTIVSYFKSIQKKDSSIYFLIFVKELELRIIIAQFSLFTHYIKQASPLILHLTPN